jgi:hypothetical protein
VSYLSLAKKIQAETGIKAGAVPATDPTEGEVIAVLIDSTVLGAEIWFALRDNFRRARDDNRAVFFADELEFLSTKTPETFREIHKVKLAVGGGRVRQ